ncbi:MAG TPA: hypothetical protein VHX38_21270 [Pseudonocardiaceae bacterium]|jgi:hypothetical protein|nr:hypothetical protein [Pseudonocardiaceae bacterium]
MRRSLRRGVTVLAGLLLAMGALPALISAAPTLPTTVTAGALPTPQTNGIVWAVTIVGNTVYAGGRFTEARPAGSPAGTNEVPRNNLLAFNLTTGALLPWAPVVSGTAYSSSTNPGPYCQADGSQWLCDSVFRIKASADGSEIYVGGDFDHINGQYRSRIAEFDTATGNLNQTFAPVVNSRVRGISVTSNAVYIGGGFSSVNGVARTRLAAIDPTTGATLPWAPTADGEVFSVLAAPNQGNKVLVGGNFNNVNGVHHRGIMSVDATTGANSSPWTVSLPGTVSVVTDIEPDGAGNAIIGAYNYGDGATRFEGRSSINIAGGNTNWYDGCYGDTQAVVVSNGVIYSVSHTHECDPLGIPANIPGTYQRLIAETDQADATSTVNFNGVSVGSPIPVLLPWLPNTDGGPSSSYWQNGPWSIDANGSYVVVGGEFLTVNGQPQQSLTRFAARGVSGAVNRGPQTPFAAPSVVRNKQGQVVVTWKSTWDAQNPGLTYYVYRDGTSAPVYTTSSLSVPWNEPTLSYTDTSAPAGIVSYWIKAVDADGVGEGSPHGSSTN